MIAIGFIGAGKMASAIINGLDKETFSIQISGRTPDTTQKTADMLGIKAAVSHAELIESSDIVVLAVKPHIIPAILSAHEINKPLVSIAAGMTLSDLASLTTSKQPLIRVMPNINATIQK